MAVKKLSIYDGLTPVLDFIAQRHYGLARESLQVAGSKLRNQASIDIKKYRHNWQQKMLSANRRKIWKDSTSSRILGTVTNRGGKRTLNHDNIGKMISFYLPPSNSPSALSVVVAGSHPSFYPSKYKDGVDIGKMKREKARDKVTRAIYHKLNTGELDKYHPYRIKTMIKNAEYKERGFMDNALSNAKSMILESLDKRYKKVMPKVVNNTNLEIKRVRA